MPNSDEKRGGSGNFANDPQRASEAGKKGGEHSHGGQAQHEQGQPHKSGQQGGTGSATDNNRKSGQK